MKIGKVTTVKKSKSKPRRIQWKKAAIALAHCAQFAINYRSHLGKGTGERTVTTDNGQGKLAASFTVVRLGANAAAARDPNKRPLLDKKEQLEQAIEKLKFEKAAMPAQEYKRQLTQLLLELAKTQEALDKP